VCLIDFAFQSFKTSMDHTKTFTSAQAKIRSIRQMLSSGTGWRLARGTPGQMSGIGAFIVEYSFLEILTADFADKNREVWRWKKKGLAEGVL
jgi:hypothetical protein